VVAIAFRGAYGRVARNLPARGSRISHELRARHDPYFAEGRRLYYGIMLT